MATGTTNAISKDSGITTQIRLYYSTTFNASTSTSTVSLIPQLYATSNLGGDVRFYAGGVSSAGVYGGSSTNTSNLYTLSGNYGSGQYLMANNTSWGNLNPDSGSISTFTIKHGKDGKATFYGGVVGKVITMYDYSTSTYSNTSSNKSGCSATITVSAPYSISYNANGGSGAPASQGVFATYSYQLSTTIPTRSGYNFLGWSTSSSASTATYTPGQSVTITGNLPLYAVWSLSEKTVFLSAGENISEVQGSGTYTTGQMVNCVALTEKDPNYIYTFSGWYNGGTLVSSDNPYTFSMGNDNISLEARASRTKVDVPSISSITIPNGDVYAVKDAYAREAIENLWSYIYPVGSIYMSVNSTDPGTLFGGTWEQLKDRFLLAAGTTYTAGATGGEATHKLTTTEMPSHTHYIYGGNGDPPDWFGGSGNAYGIKQRTGSAYDYLQYVGGNGAHNNMPPYLVVYMWKRTA